MKMNAQNKLAYYQSEYQGLYEQTQILQAKAPALECEIQNLAQYLSANVGDRTARANYSKATQRYNTLNNTIRHNMMRLQTLQRQIAIESQKVQSQMMKQQMKACGVRGRYAYNGYNY